MHLHVDKGLLWRNSTLTRSIQSPSDFLTAPPSIIRSAVDLPLQFPSGNKQTIMFYVTLLEASCIAVLGYNWLTWYNLLIDWVLGSIKFRSPLQTDSLTSPETVAMAPLSSNPLTPTPFIAPKVSFINAAAFTRLSKMDDNQVYQLFLSDKTAPDYAPVNMTGIPPDYHEFTNIFSKTRASTPALHRPYDLKIELEQGTSPPFGPIYSLSQSELKYLSESFQMNILRWISSTCLTCRAELRFCSYARRMDHSASASTSTV